MNLTKEVAKKEKEDIFGKICLKNRLFSNFCSGEAEYGFLKYVVLERSLRQASEVDWLKRTCSTVFGIEKRCKFKKKTKPGLKKIKLKKNEKKTKKKTKKTKL